MPNLHNEPAFIDPDFDGHNTLYATHSLHAFAAKCPPRLAKWGIEKYSDSKHLILDPITGGGTTLVEARLLGRHASGFDIDPLACLIARVRSRILDDKKIADSYNQLARRLWCSLIRITLGWLAEALIGKGVLNEAEQAWEDCEQHVTAAQDGIGFV